MFVNSIACFNFHRGTSMSKVQVAAISDAVHKLQLALLDGIQDETQLFAAGSLMSRSDYEDIVTERAISKICGYPLCPNALPSERPRKSHYRISLKEHKVYDLHETYMYCSSSCLINSQAFAGSLQDQRCLVMNPAKLNEILRLFKNLGVESGVEMGKNGDLGISKLSIQEKTDIKGGEVSLEEWIGPSDAIEGYVPQRDRNAKPSCSKATKEGYEPDGAKLKLIKQNDTVHNNLDFKVDVISNEDKIGPRNAPANEKYSGTNQSKTSKPLLSEMDFTSTIFTNDESTVSEKLDDGSKCAHSNVAKGGSKQIKSGSNKGKDPIFCDMDFMSTIITQDEYSISKPDPSQVMSEANRISRQFAEKLGFGDAEKQPKSWEDSGPAENDLQSSMDESSGMGRVSHHIQDYANSSTTQVNGESRTEQAVQSSQTTVKSSLRTSRARRAARSVTWADEKISGPDSGNLCEIREFKNTKEGPRTDFSKEAGDDDDDYARFALAEACAAALSQAAEAVASGQSDVTDAVSEAGIIVLPHPQQADEGEDPIADDALKEAASSKLNSDLFNSNDSWFDAPPEDFSLTLSPFATMWNALFSWMTSSSLACIYGRDETSHEEYLFVNGREYPGKIVLPDGRSSEIKRTLAGCLARALPGVIAVLKLPTPVSTLEQGLACLLDTLSFMDALPPFRLKQWQVIVLLFIDALSICRIPGLAPYLTSRRILIPKVLDSAQITAKEYEIMKDLVIPLGRVPHFSMQSGG